MPALGDVDHAPGRSLSLNVRGLRASATLAIQERCAELAREGRVVYRLGLGQSPFPVPEAVVETLRANAARKDYLPVRGLHSLRETVAEFHRKRHGIACTAEDVLVAPGSKELLFLLQLVYYGDLLIPSPGWVSYAPQARIAGRAPIYIHTRREDGFMLRAADLEAACADDPERPRVLILNYPSNPTGGTYAAATLEELAVVARRHRIVVLSDEIYGELEFEGRHVSMARFYPEGTIISSGLSKWCGAGGWRLGTCTFPAQMRWLVDAMAAVASETYTTTSAPIQYAAVRAFQGGTAIESYLASVRRVLYALVTRCAAMLEAAGARVPRASGAFYLFPDLERHRERLGARGMTTSRAVCARLLEETGVAALPGSDFGRPDDELTLRLALVDFDGSKALAAARDPRGIDDEFIALHCANVLRAVDLFCGWVTS